MYNTRKYNDMESSFIGHSGGYVGVNMQWAERYNKVYWYQYMGMIEVMCNKLRLGILGIWADFMIF